MLEVKTTKSVKSHERINEAVAYLLYLYAFVICISISVTHVVLSLIVLLFLTEWWKKKKVVNIQRDFSLFAVIYGWKGITLLANGFISKVVRVKELWYKVPYLVIGRTDITREQLFYILNVLFITNSILVVYAVGQKYFLFPEIYKSLFDISGRMIGYLGNPQYYAGHITIVLVLCLSLTLFYNQKYVVYLPFLVGGLLFSASRTYFIVAIISVLLLAYFKSRRIFLIILALIPLTFIAGLALIPEISERLSSNLLKMHWSDRFSYWTVAWSIFKVHPLFGIGFNEFFSTKVHQYVDLGILSGEGNVHNLYLQELVEGGLIGFLLVTFVMGYFVRKYYLYFKISEDRLLSGTSIGISISFFALMIAGATEAHLEFPVIWFLITFIMGICEAYKNGLKKKDYKYSEIDLPNKGSQINAVN